MANRAEQEQAGLNKGKQGPAWVSRCEMGLGRRNRGQQGSAGTRKGEQSQIITDFGKNLQKFDSHGA